MCIRDSLDTAIEKITEVTTSVNRMLAVHEEKLSQQEEASNRANKEFSDDIKELHSRITTNSKEMRDMITKYQIEQTAHIENLRSDLNGRVGVLEKWRWLIIGGSIVIGFAIQEIPIWG